MAKKLKMHSKHTTLALICLVTGGVAYSQEVVKQFNISAQRLSTALAQFSEQSDIVVIAPADLVNGKRANTVQGNMLPEQALLVLLEGTGLRYSKDELGVKVIAEESRSSESQLPSKKNREDANDENKIVEEILVTASKQSRATRLQDTPVSIASLGADDLEKRNISGIKDYMATIPGVSTGDWEIGTNRISMRGVAASNFEDSTISMYFGEIPVTTAGNNAGIDLKTVDVERIEVLRGPQGTLYGSGSLGGLVRTIPKAPQLGEFEAEIGTGVSQTEGAGGLNSKLTGMVNIPLMEDKLALRVVGYHFENQGYYELVGASDPVFSAAATSYGLSGVDRI